MKDKKQCPVCGAEFVQPRTGRPKVYCSGKCQRRAYTLSGKSAARNKRWREKHPEEAKARNKRWCEEHPEEEKAQKKRYREEHPEEVKAGHKRWCEKHPEEVKAWQKRWREEHPEEVKAGHKRWCESLADSYVRGLLAKRTKLPASAIPQSMVELKRVQLQIERELTNGQ